MAQSFTSVIYVFQKGEWKLRNLSLDEPILSILDAKSKKPLKAYDLNAFDTVNDHYTAVSLLQTVDDSLRFSQPLFYFTLNQKPASFGDEKPIAGLLPGQVLFACTNETKRDEWITRIQKYIRSNTGSSIKSQMAQHLPEHFQEEEKEPEGDEYPDLPMNEITETDPDIIIDETKKMNLDELDFGGLFLDCWPNLKGGPVHKRLPKIPIVDLSENLFTKIPEEVLLLKNVVEFDFSSNKLGCFPEELREFSKLEHLEISNNPIANLNSSVGYLSKLEFLEAKNCSLYIVDQNIGMLRHLTQLDLSENPDLTSIPAAIGDIRSLEYINVSSCRLTAIPKELFYNVHLREINASKNKIAMVPAEIGHCKRLEKVYFQNNKIGAIPAILGQCKSLKVLNFENNAFRDPNFDLKRRLDELMAYLNELLVSEPQPKLAPIPHVTKTGDVQHDHTNEMSEAVNQKHKPALSSSKDPPHPNRPQFSDSPAKGRPQARVAEYKRSVRIRKSLRIRSDVQAPKKIAVSNFHDLKNKPITNSTSNSNQKMVRISGWMMDTIEGIKGKIFKLANGILATTNPQDLIPYVSVLKSIKQELDRVKHYVAEPVVNPPKATDKFERAKETILIGYKEVNLILSSLVTYSKTKNVTLEQLLLMAYAVRTINGLGT